MVYSVTLTALSCPVVPSNLIASGTWQWQRAAAGIQSRHVVQQIDTEPGEVDPRLVKELRSLATSAQSVPIIITYHDRGLQPPSPTCSAASTCQRRSSSSAAVS